MADEPTRQHYKMATGKGTNSAPGGQKIAAKRGGAVKGGSKGASVGGGKKTPC